MRLTHTTLIANGKATATVAERAPVVLQATTAAATAGAEVLQVDGFDPLTGWYVYRLLHATAAAGTVRWTPPAAGRWRVRASYLGSVTSSPSRSCYVLVVVGGA